VNKGIKEVETLDVKDRQVKPPNKLSTAGFIFRKFNNRLLLSIVAISSSKGCQHFVCKIIATFCIKMSKKQFSQFNIYPPLPQVTLDFHSLIGTTHFLRVLEL
jgi:hypothetical protein